MARRCLKEPFYCCCCRDAAPKLSVTVVEEGSVRVVASIFKSSNLNFVVVLEPPGTPLGVRLAVSSSSASSAREKTSSLSVVSSFGSV